MFLKIYEIYNGSLDGLPFLHYNSSTEPSVVCLKNFSEICMMSVAQAIGKIEIYEAIH